MVVSVREHSAGFRIFTVRVGESKFELSSFGGQLLSWTEAGIPILFSNADRAIVDGQTAYRGGAPICFPYFGKGSFLPSETLLAPQHGRARTSVWETEVLDDSIVFRTEQPTPEGSGPTRFGCELAYVFGDGLKIEARIANIGDNAAPCQFVVHSYWACEDPSKVTVSGLGERYLDNLIGYQEARDPSPDAPHLPPFDRVYPDALDQLTLDTGRYCLKVSTEGGAGAVLWNPGREHGLKDLDEADFVCLESGVVTPSRVLAPGDAFSVRINYRI